jgi:hypothetical protein
MSFETFDAIFMTVMPLFMLCGLVLFPISIIGKFVLMAVFLKAIRSGTVSPLLALLLGPAALMLARNVGDKETTKTADKAVVADSLTPPLPDIPDDNRNFVH